MSIQVNAIVGATVYDLTNSGFKILAIADLGHAPSERLTQRGPNQHGDSDLGFRLLPRVFSLIVSMGGAGADDVFTDRTALLNIFKSTGTKLSLQFIFTSGAIRQIDCVVSGGLDMPRDGSMGGIQKTGIMLRASNPVFYDPTGEAYSVDMGGGPTGGFAVPLIIPISIGQSSGSGQLSIPYAGSWESNPVVRINGPITNPVVTRYYGNNSGILDFTGATIQAGDYYQIDTGYSARTVVDSSGNNKISTLLDTSDLGNFALKPAPDAASGTNVILITGTGINSLTHVDISYYDNYIGI